MDYEDPSLEWYNDLMNGHSSAETSAHAPVMKLQLKTEAKGIGEGQCVRKEEQRSQKNYFKKSLGSLYCIAILFHVFFQFNLIQQKAFNYIDLSLFLHSPLTCRLRRRWKRAERARRHPSHTLCSVLCGANCPSTSLYPKMLTQNHLR